MGSIPDIQWVWCRYTVGVEQIRSCNRGRLLDAYHAAGGEFHGREADAHLPKKRARRRRLIVTNEDDTDSMDDAFDI